MEFHSRRKVRVRQEKRRLFNIRLRRAWKRVALMASKPKFNFRKLMEKAVEMMRQSISEPRADKKASPLVGAVLCKPDGGVETAFRGELRHSDNAYWWQPSGRPSLAVDQNPVRQRVAGLKIKFNHR